MVFFQDTWDPDWQSTSSSKVTYLVKRLKALWEANRKSGYTMDGDSDTKDVHELVSFSDQHNCIGMLQQDYTRRSDETFHTSSEKVLIFSQFLEHIHVIEQQVAAIYLRLGVTLVCFSSCLLYFFSLPVNSCWYQIFWHVQSNAF